MWTTLLIGDKNVTMRRTRDPSLRCLPSLPTGMVHRSERDKLPTRLRHAQGATNRVIPYWRAGRAVYTRTASVCQC